MSYYCYNRDTRLKKLCQMMVMITTVGKKEMQGMQECSSK
jgi:hypothetical protein